MTDECYDAKQWMKRVHIIARRVESNERMLEVLQDRVNQAVARYENSGAAVDREQANKRKEEEMLEYVEQQEKVERSRNLLAKETHKVRRIISKIDDPILEEIATNRYINRLSWNDVIRISNYSRAQVFRYHLHILEKVAGILREEGIR